MMTTLKIEHQRGGRGLTDFILKLGEERIALASYRPGNVAKRTATAKAWHNSAQLAKLDGQRPTVEQLVGELERAELTAFPVVGDEGDEGDARQRGAASYIDEDVIADLAWNSDAGEPDFIVFDRKERTVHRASMVADHVVPPSLAKVVCTPGGNISGCCFLPTLADPEEDGEESLRRDVRAFIHRSVELPGDAEIIAVEYVFLTWVYDAFEELPYLAFRTADCGRGKSRALETVGALCYRPLFCGGGSSAAATLRMIDTLRGTLIADEFDGNHDTELTAEITRILNQGFQRNRPLVKCVGDACEPRAFSCYGPKLFSLRKRLGDDASESRTISIRMTQRMRDDIPRSLPRKRFDAEALAIRNRLLYWRFIRFGSVQVDEKLADKGLEDRGNQIALPLLSLAQNPEVREIIVAALRQQQADVAADRSESWAGEVLAAALVIGQPGGKVRPTTIAAQINRQRADADRVEVDKLHSSRRLSANKTARIMAHDLELPRGGKDRSGAYYILDRSRLKLLCQRFGIPLQETSPSSHRHTEGKNALLDHENAVRDEGDDGDVVTKGGDELTERVISAATDSPIGPSGNGDDRPPLAVIAEAAEVDDGQNAWGELE
jgi:hypothetical protein